MAAFLLWYAVISLVGLAAVPLTYYLLPALPGKGYAFSRVAGLLVWGFAFWLLGSYGLLGNNSGGLFLALGVLLGVSGFALYKTGLEPILDWFRANKAYVLVIEILFFAAFLGWTLVRFADPDITFTEKPMELAFINAILKSPQFPPNDPWLSGYAISYYYFGYILTAMLASVTNITAGVAFNLALALVFALAAIGACGLVFNMLALRSGNTVSNAVYALFGPMFVLVLSNVGGFLDLLHARGVGWRTAADGSLVSGFWPWLDMKELSLAPAFPFSETPSRFLWWWRSSRVLADYDFNGNFREVIDEFPFFSFLLGDLHPHVLTIPFVLLALAFSLNLYLGGARGETRLFNWRFEVSPLMLGTAGVVLGALGFLNTWDFPIYVGVFSGAYVLYRVREQGWEMARLWDFIQLSIVVIALGVVFFLPFYLSFSSQAGGILPNLINPTRGAHFWVMYGTLLLPLIAYLLNFWRREGGGRGPGWGAAALLFIGILGAAAVSNLANGAQIQNAWGSAGSLMTIVALLVVVLFLYFWHPEGPGEHLKTGVVVSLGFAGVLWFFSLFLGVVIAAIPAIGDLPVIGELFVRNLHGAPSGGVLLAESLYRRFTTPGGWTTIVLFLGLAVAVILFQSQKDEIVEEKADESRDNLFPILLIVMGGLLVLGPEFVYLRDNFNTRMNTIFKFYYQTWILWGVAAAYGTAILLKEGRGLAGRAIAFGSVVVILIGLTYPVLSLQTKTNGFNLGENPILDGTLTHSAYLTLDDVNAVDWLKQAPLGNLTEAVGGQYSHFARISAHSGMPTVLGWAGHEGQWRGGYEEVGTREADIRTIYASGSWEETRELLDRYAVRYIYVGPLERSTYRVNELKFSRNLEPVYLSGQVTIYGVPAQK